ncbi:MAG: hypothetical protein ABI193_17235, partial [Minicystis sp.]
MRLLAKQALARVGPVSAKTPILLVAPREAVSGEAELARFLTLGGHTVASCRTGAAAYVSALREAEGLLEEEEEVIVLAVDSLIEQGAIEDWRALRYSTFTRNPLPPSEGAVAMRLSKTTRPPLAGKVHAVAAGLGEATDDNDLPADGAALTRVFA